MRIAFFLSCVTACAMLSVPALSAEKSLELTEVSGKVLVTTKDGALPAVMGQELAEGSQVFVGNDATARLTSADGACDVTLPAEKVTVINYKKLCDVRITPTAYDGATGGLPPPVVGLAFFGVAAGAAIWTLLDDDNNPVSAP